MDVKRWLVPVVLLAPLLWFAPRLLAARALTRQRFGRVRVEVAERASLPPAVEQVLAPLLAELKVLGLVERQLWRRAGEEATDCDGHIVEAAHPAGTVRAVLRLETDACGAARALICFRTLLVDGREIETRNLPASRMGPQPPMLEREVLEGMGVAWLLERHLERTAAVVPKGLAVIALDADAARAREQAMADEALDHWRKSGDTVQDRDGCLRCRFGAAFRHAGARRPAKVGHKKGRE